MFYFRSILRRRNSRDMGECEQILERYETAGGDKMAGEVSIENI